jgi:glycosyltransferase involved in cell wall biosynthesis
MLCASEQTLHALTVNIFAKNLHNGAGKEVDIQIVKDGMERHGHQVRLYDFNKSVHVTHADINIFFAEFNTKIFPQARLNWFIPNAEFCKATINELAQCDLVLCKTEESLRIFKPISNVFYLGFTSLDRYDPTVIKDYSSYLHLAGRSKYKGTTAVLDTWKDHSSFPRLLLIKDGEVKNGSAQNIELIQRHISNKLLLQIQNECGVHLCPSKTEGYGHYIAEAMSATAVVITTNAPPMNEFITDPRCLVDYSSTAKQNYATIYIVSPKELAKAVKSIQKLPVEELEKIGKKNREEYLRRQQEFENNFDKLISKTEQELQETLEIKEEKLRKKVHRRAAKYAEEAQRNKRVRSI